MVKIVHTVAAHALQWHDVLNPGNSVPTHAQDYLESQNTGDAAATVVE